VTVFTTQDSTGIGTILGSAVFNLVMIVSVSGLFGLGPKGLLREKCEAAYRASGATSTLPHGLFLDWRPFIRDCFFYTVSLILCCVFAMSDVGDWSNNEVDNRPGFRWYEGLILVLGYGVYLITMIKNDSFMACLKRCGGMAPHIKVYTEDMESKRNAQNDDNDGYKDDEQIIDKTSVSGGLRFYNADGDNPDPLSRRLERIDTLARQQKNNSEAYKHKEGPKFSGGVRRGLNKFQDANSHTRGAHRGNIPRTEGFEMLTASFTDDGLSEIDGYQQPEFERVTTRVSPDRKGNASDAGPTRAHHRLKEIQYSRNEIEREEGQEAETVRLLVGEVVHLRETIVGLQNRIIPLYETSAADYRPYLKSDVNNGDEHSSPKRSCCGSILYALSIPWVFAFRMTVPACERDDFQTWDTETPIKWEDIPLFDQKVVTKQNQDYDIEDDDIIEGYWVRGRYSRSQVDTWYDTSLRYWFSFIMSIMWIWIVSWGMVEFAYHIGCFLNISSYVMGLVVLAAGTSIPDTLSSVMVAKRGLGDMAVANAVGSNVFNIFLGIGLPMLFTEFIWGTPFIVTDLAEVAMAGLMLITITILQASFIHCSKWILTKKLSGFLMVFFFLYIILSIVFELDRSLAYEAIDEYFQVTYS
jgi:Ca2+/Na+ antiporter